MMSKNLVGIGLLFTLATAACVQSQTATNGGTAGNVNSDGNSATISASVPTENKIGNTAADSKTFLGYIGGSRIQISLIRDGDKISGSYFYQKIGTPLKLSGAVSKQNDFVLQETDQSGNKTGEWKGTWKDSGDGITLEGKWKNPKGAPSLDFYAAEQQIEFKSAAKITTKTSNEDDKTRYSKITDEYPELSGVDTATAAKFNEIVKNYVAKANTEYKSSVADFTPEETKRFATSGLYQELTYDVVSANENLISLVFYDSTFSGGAHGNSTTKTINYDLKNNRELTLADLFEPNSDYLQTLSKLSLADLKAQKIEATDDEMLNDGTTPKAENFASWNLTKKGLRFNFDAYQVASYAAGPQSVVISYAKLEKILRKDGIVTGLMR